MAESNGTWFWRAVVQGVFMALLVTLLGTVLSVRVTNAITPPSCDATKDLVSYRPTSQEASSSRASEYDSQGRLLTYGPDRVLDGDTATGWAEGEEGLGLNETLTFHFAHPVTLTQLCIVDGYAQSWALYTRNPRVRAVAVTAAQQGNAATTARVLQLAPGATPTGAGEPAAPGPVVSHLVTLSDAGTQDHVAVFQTAAVDLPDVQSLTLQIASVYAGTTVDRFADTSISEIEFWGPA